MKEENILNENSEAVQTHLKMIQSIINRMATNSASCKTWCITLVSAILVIVTGKEVNNYGYISIIPIILFLALDSYYLALEKIFRKSYNKFVKKIHSQEARVEDLYVMSPPKENLFKEWFKSIFSFSIGPFYFILLLMIGCFFCFDLVGFCV